MSLVVHSLASGSSGNCILVRDEKTALLLDAGIGIRSLVPLLRHAGVEVRDLAGILITHEHSDHTRGAVSIARRHKVPIIANAETLEAIDQAEQVPHHVLDVGEEMNLGDLHIRPFSVSHDAVRPVGYSISSTSTSICSATDTGIITPQLHESALAADLLIVESNHDVEMLRAGPYPAYLKQRIASDVGHLSNATTALLLAELADSGRPASVWLAHLSRTNNSPKMALETAREATGSRLGHNLKIEVARRDVPSARWEQGRKVFQLSLFGPSR